MSNLRYNVFLGITIKTPTKIVYHLKKNLEKDS